LKWGLARRRIMLNVDEMMKAYHRPRKRAGFRSPPPAPRLEDLLQADLRGEIGVYDRRTAGRGTSHRARRRQKRQAKRLAQPVWHRQRDKHEREQPLKTELDWVMHRAAQTPGPADYETQVCRESPVQHNLNLAGRFSVHDNPSALEWLLRMKKKIPGPQDYEVPPPRPSTASAVFATVPPPHPEDWAMKEAANTPGPGEYKVKDWRPPTAGPHFPRARCDSALNKLVERTSKVGLGMVSEDEARKTRWGRRADEVWKKKKNGQTRFGGSSPPE